MKSMLKHKNGFTLVELLAVIVILALLIVITANTVLPMMNKSKEKAMVIYAESVLKRAGEAYVIDSMYNGGEPKEYIIEDLMGQNDYSGIVRVSLQDNEYAYSISMNDEKEEVGLKVYNKKEATINESSEDIVSSSNYNPNIVHDYQNTVAANDSLEKIFNTNFINTSEIVAGAINSGGVLDTAYNYNTSGCIKLKKNTEYLFMAKITETSTTGIAWYEDKNCTTYKGKRVYTEDEGNDDKVIIKTDEYTYLRLSWPNSNSDADIFLIKNS